MRLMVVEQFLDKRRIPVYILSFVPLMWTTGSGFVRRSG